MDLFGNTDEHRTFDDVLALLNRIADDFIKEFELPVRGVKVLENIGKGKDNTGKVISYSICINEPDYPASESDMLDENRTHIKLTTIQRKELKRGNIMIVTVDNFILGAFPPPSDAVLLAETKTDVESGKRRLEFDIDSKTFEGWIIDLVRYRIKTFVSAADSFGCCSRFNECSDAKKCIHPNRLYSTACTYRRHLEAGEIFYGGK